MLIVDQIEKRIKRYDNVKDKEVKCMGMKKRLIIIRVVKILK